MLYTADQRLDKLPAFSEIRVREEDLRRCNRSGSSFSWFPRVSFTTSQHQSMRVGFKDVKKACFSRFTNVLGDMRQLLFRSGKLKRVLCGRTLWSNGQSRLQVYKLQCCVFA